MKNMSRCKYSWRQLEKIEYQKRNCFKYSCGWRSRLLCIFCSLSTVIPYTPAVALMSPCGNPVQLHFSLSSPPKLVLLSLSTSVGFKIQSVNYLYILAYITLWIKNLFLPQLDYGLLFIAYMFQLAFIKLYFFSVTFLSPSQFETSNLWIAIITRQERRFTNSVLIFTFIWEQIKSIYISLFGFSFYQESEGVFYI